MKQDSLKPYTMTDCCDIVHDGHKANKQCYKTLASVFNKYVSQLIEQQWQFLVNNSPLWKSIGIDQALANFHIKCISIR